MDTILTVGEYSEHVGVPEEVLKGSSRKDQYKIPRQIYWLYLNNHGLSKREIARRFNKDHTSVINGIRTISNLIDTNDKILLQYESFLTTFLHLPQSN